MLFFTPGVPGFMACIFGFIFSGITLYVFLFATKFLKGEISAVLFGAIFGGPFFFAMAGTITGGHLPAALTIGVLGAVLGGAAAGIIHNFSTMHQELDQEVLQAQEHLERGITTAKYGHYTKSITYLKMAVNSKKSRAPDRIAFLIAQAYENNLHNLHEAIYWYRRTIGFANSLGEDKKNIFAREAREGIARLTKLKKRKNIRVVDELSKAKELIEKEEFKEGEQLLGDLAKLYPDNSDVTYLFAHLHLRRHRTGMAVEYFKRALKNDPKNVLAAYFLAGTLEEDDRLKEAKEALLRYIALAKDDKEESERLMIAKKRIEVISKKISFAPIVE